MFRFKRAKRAHVAILHGRFDVVSITYNAVNADIAGTKNYGDELRYYGGNYSDGNYGDSLLNAPNRAASLPITPSPIT